jgi:hypothetical protein
VGVPGSCNHCLRAVEAHAAGADHVADHPGVLLPAGRRRREQGQSDAARPRKPPTAGGSWPAAAHQVL